MPESEYTDAPKTLGESGQPPETRIGPAPEVQNRILLLQKADQQSRSLNRARVKGLVDGNPPYRAGDLRNAGRADACNVNWRTSEAHLNNARGAFYDAQNEVPHFATVSTAIGGRKAKQYSQIISEEFDWLIRSRDEDFDYETQISQYEMVLYGCGPLMFEDNYSFCAVAIPNRNLLVPEFALSRQTKWEECAVLVDYYVADLYKNIRKSEAATSAGWNVAAVRKAIMRACPKTQQGAQYQNWEWHQQQLKNNSCSYSAQSLIVQCAHYYVREFPEGNEECGRITHAIVLLNSGTDSSGVEANDFLFKKVGRYANWRELIHPMYYDNDGGGYHHSVTGMGRKMYSAMEAENRLLCNTFDKAFAPKIFFQPTTANSAEVMNIIKYGDWAKVPPGFQSVQIPVGSFMDETLVLHRTLKGLISSNLSQYRQNMEEKSGNPITAEEMRFRAANISQLGKTQLNHFWNQWDWYYEEKYRRASKAMNKSMPYGKDCIEFQERCLARGVPIEAIRNVESVKATRTVGQGSPFMRLQAITQLLGTSQLNPSPAGRSNIYKDYVAAQAGQAMVDRYAPEIADAPAQDDQAAIATLQVGNAKLGIAPVVSMNQDSFVFAQTFMQAMSQALMGLEEGGNPMEVHQFIETLGPATIKHIQLLSEDPRQQKMAKRLQADWKRIAGMHDKLGARIEKMKEQAEEQERMHQQAAAARNGGDPQMQLKAAQAEADNKRKNVKLANDMRRKDAQTKQKMATTAATTRQKMALADATTANSILNENRRAEASSDD